MVWDTEVVRIGYESTFKRFHYFFTDITLDAEKELTFKLIEILTKKDATPEEKKVQALLKSALLSDNLSTFIIEIELASISFAIEPPPCLANGALEIIHSPASAAKVKEVRIKVFAHPLAN